MGRLLEGAARDQRRYHLVRSLLHVLRDSVARQIRDIPFCVKLMPVRLPSGVPLRAGLNGVIDALSGAHHVLEMFRRTLPDGPSRTCLDHLGNRLTKIITEAKSLAAG